MGVFLEDKFLALFPGYKHSGAPHGTQAVGKDKLSVPRAASFLWATAVQLHIPTVSLPVSSADKGKPARNEPS